MRIVVTGAGGFLGSHLLRRLRAGYPDAELWGVVRTRPPGQVEGVRYATQLEASDVVFHLAGGGSVAASLQDPGADLLLNTKTTVEVLERVRSVGTGRLVMASSVAVYGRAQGIVSEDQPTVPVSPYGVSKLASELYVRAYEALYGLDACVARIGNAYGPGQRQLVVHDLALRALTEPPPLRLHGTGEEIRDFIYVDDVCDALALIAFSGKRGSTYNVASGHHVSMRELATFVMAAAGSKDVRVWADGAPDPGKPSVFCPSIERLASLGFLARVSLETGVRETVAWLRSDR